MRGNKKNLKLILNQFITFEKDSKIVYKCKHCSLVYTFKNITKMTKHILQKCSNCPVDVKTVLKKVVNTKIQIITTKHTQENHHILQSSQSLSVPPPRAVTPFTSPSAKIMSNFDQLDTSEKNTANYLLAKAIFSSGTPLSIVENQHWKSFLNFLRPAYELPTRKILSTTMLDSHYDEVKQDVEMVLAQSEYISLQLDGWSNKRSEGIINFTITTSDQKHFYIKSLDTKHIRHTSDYIATEIVKIINQYNNTKFIAIITDNTTNMRKATETVSEMFPYISNFGCLAHTLNLVVTDLIKLPTIANLVVEVIDIIKCIKNCQILGNIFDSIKKSRNFTESLVLPVITHWCSYLFTLQSMLACKTSLQTLVANEEAVNILGRERKQLILDEQIFWACVENTKRLLKPLVYWILWLESNENTLNVSCKVFSEIKKSFEDNFPLLLIKTNEVEPFMETFLERKEYALKSIHKAACLADPKSQGGCLTHQEQMEAIEYIIDFTKTDISTPIAKTNLLMEIAQYRAHEGIWAKQFIWDSVQNENMSPNIWWKGIIGKNNELSNIALQILSVPATSTSTERNFSTIHTKMRTDRAKKLNYIAHYWRTKLKPSKLNFSSTGTEPRQCRPSDSENIELICTDSNKISEPCSSASSRISQHLSISNELDIFLEDEETIQFESDQDGFNVNDSDF